MGYLLSSWHTFNFFPVNDFYILSKFFQVITASWFTKKLHISAKVANIPFYGLKSDYFFSKSKSISYSSLKF